MHQEARAFLEYVRSTYSVFFRGRVLDVGSADINGNNRGYCKGCDYVGCDVAPGSNVDVVSPCHLLPYPDASFDVIISSECLEHDMHYTETLHAIARLLKPGGLFVFTCASTGRPEHGTRRSTPGDSYTTRTTDTTNTEWAEYYKNLTAEDIRAVLPLDDLFAHHDMYYNSTSQDLYFVGIKKFAPFHSAQAI